MSLGIKIKDPADIRIYVINWATWLGSYTISTSAWTLPSGLTDVADSNTSTTTQIKISGGSNGREYTVANTIVNSNGETKKVSFQLHVETQ